MRPLLEARDLSVEAPGGRPLFDGLTLRLERERVALVGRNGVGKSTLLAALAEAHERIRARSQPYLVPQVLAPATLSHGERRRRALDEARASGAEILLLDEPSEDLDEAGVAWLAGWLRSWPGCLVVATHDQRLLETFRHFLVASESGCRYFCGSLAELDEELERDHQSAERRYAGRLRQLVAAEERTAHVARRKARKKRYGRCAELDRATPRIRLNQKRDQAQDSHGRIAKVREARLAATREWTRGARRALKVDLALELVVPVLPEFAGRVIALHDASVVASGRELFRLDLEIERERVGLVGPNGAGKTTLLDVVLGRRRTSTGSAARDLSKIGVIEQGGANWTIDDSLATHLTFSGVAQGAIAELFVAHRFPLALAQRPLRSLSPGERTRAALIALFRRTPPAQVLVLDEPTYSLDLVGQRAVTAALRAWPGGLLVASHDRAFLSALRLDRLIALT